MSGDLISDIQRDYLVELARKGLRVDGRGPDEYRPVQLRTGAVSQAQGSAEVHLGNTRVFVGVKLMLGTPYPDTPDQGVLTTSAELMPIASPEFEPGPPKPEAIEVSRVVDRGIRESKMIDTSKLCIVPYKNVWMCYVDIHVVDYDGNLFDAATLGAVAALKTCKVPWSKLLDHPGIQAEPQARTLPTEDQPLPVSETPLMCTSVKIGPTIFMDPTLLEEKVASPRISVSVDSRGDVRAMQKGLIGGFTKAEVVSVMKRSRSKAAELRAVLDDRLRM